MVATTDANGIVVNRKRPHRKVRSGCVRCKARKIKCDEIKPRCSHCERYSVDCVYPILNKDNESTSSTSPPAPINVDTPPKSPGHTSVDTQPTFNLSDLELMHHWTSSAYQGFVDMPNQQKSWQVDIPRLALQHPFLMHGILSAAALHLSTFSGTQPQQYCRTAAYHQNEALAPYRDIMTDIKGNLTEQNCHALLAFAAFTTAFSLAYSHCPGGDCDNEQKGPVPDWFLMIRGPRNVVQTPKDDWNVCAIAGPWLIKGPMAFQLQFVESPVDTSFNPDDNYLAALETLFQHDEQHTSSQQNDMLIYRQTLSLLREFSAIPYLPNTPLGPKMAIFQFVERAPQQYIDLLSNGRPEALILLAYFAVLLKKAAPTSWYMNGAAERVLNAVSRFLPSGWQTWTAWPKQQIYADTMLS